MKVVIQPNAEAAAEFAARMVAAELRENPFAAMGFAAGRTMEPVYARLVEWHRTEALDFSRCRAFHLDEYVGLPAGDEHSFRHFLTRRLYSQVNLDPRRVYFLDGAAPDLEAECERYERQMVRAGRIDLQLLGIGRSGHIGFNEPGSSSSSSTRVVDLAPATLRQNAPLFGGRKGMPRRAVTMGLGTILDCRRCLLLATGKEKSKIVAQAIEGPLTEKIPASALHLHFDCTVVLDRPAASALKESVR